MTRPGPKPKSTALRVFEGNPGDKPLNDHEPKPDADKASKRVEWLEPDCEYMQDGTTFPMQTVTDMIWSDMATQLEKTGVLTNIDRGKLARYCETFARWLKMKAFIDKYGETYPVYDTHYGEHKLDDGTIIRDTKRILKKMVVYPQMNLYLKLELALARLEVEFGIGAANRTRIQTIVGGATFGKEGQDEHDFDYSRRDGLRSVK